MYSTLVGVFPEWHPRLFKPLSKLKWSGAGGRAYISKFVQDKISAHEQKAQTQTQDAEKNETQSQPQDFVDKLMLARQKEPEKVTDYHLFIMGQSNVTAGSDTTAISLSTIMWHLMHYPDVLQKLREELDEFTAQGRCSSPITFKESQEMPYFQAVMKEALRMHAATGLPMWRTVPDGGAEINGRFFPGGTVVGVNTWVAHYDETVFPDAGVFRPERWIEAEDQPERLKVMNQMYMPVSFGHAMFVCFFGLLADSFDCSLVLVRGLVLGSISLFWRCLSLSLNLCRSLILLRCGRHGVRRTFGLLSLSILKFGCSGGSGVR
jgi:cytochrome P450